MNIHQMSQWDRQTGAAPSLSIHKTGQIDERTDTRLMLFRFPLDKASIKTVTSTWVNKYPNKNVFIGSLNCSKLQSYCNYDDKLFGICIRKLQINEKFFCSLIRPCSVKRSAVL